MGFHDFFILTKQSKHFDSYLDSQRKKLLNRFYEITEKAVYNK